MDLMTKDRIFLAQAISRVTKIMSNFVLLGLHKNIDTQS